MAPVKKRTLDGWRKDSVKEDSPAYRRMIYKLEQDVADGQYSMSSFADNMAEWADPKSAEGRMRQFNDQYTEYMMQLMLDSLSNGVAQDDLTSTISMAVGMCMVSKDMRARFKSMAKTAMFPAMEKRVMNRAAFMDAIDPFAGKDGRLSHQEKAEARLQKKWEKYQAAMNGGRVPLTPESCGTKYIGFCRQAYTQMRVDTPEMADTRRNLSEARRLKQEDRAKRLEEKLKTLENDRNQRVMRSFNRATGTLKTLAAADGISDEEFNQGVMSVYGKLVKERPEMERMFNQTAYGDIGKDYRYAKEKGKVVRYWSGDFVTKDGEVFRDLLTPRPPMSSKQATSKVRDIYTDAYENCHDLDEIAYMQQTQSFSSMSPYLESILADDLQADAWAAGYGSPQDYVNSVINAGHDAACKRWVKEHQGSVEVAYESQRKAATGDPRAREEQRKQWEAEKAARDARREAREAERHAWAKEEHEAKMTQTQLRNEFYRNMTKIVRNPKFATYFADYAAKHGGSVDFDKIAEDTEFGDM